MTAERPADEAALTEAERRGLGTRLAGILDGAVDDAAEWLAPVVEAIIAARLASEGEILDAAADEIEDLRKVTAAVEALADEGDHYGILRGFVMTSELRAALAAALATEAPPRAPLLPNPVDPS